MSIKIYNGYRFDRSYSIRELDEKLIELKKKIQTAANKLFSEQVLTEFLYLFDYCTFFGKEKTLELLKKYKYEKDDIEWDSVLFYVSCYVEDKIRKAKINPRRDFVFDYDCYIHILPIPRKLLFLYYGEKEEFEKILKDQAYVREYYYQNQTDRPENISAKAWKTRRKDWDKAIIDYVPVNHGFSVSLVNTEAFPLISRSFMKNINPEIPSAQKRARRVAYDVPYKDNAEFSDFFSDDYKRFLKKTDEKISKTLREIDSWEDVFELIR